MRCLWICKWHYSPLKMGDQLRRTYQTSRKNGCKIHYHCDRVPDSLGRSATDKRLYGHHNCEVSIWTRLNMIWMFEDLDEWSWYIFPKQNNRALIEEFQLYHKKITLYHPQANGTVEALQKILETALSMQHTVKRLGPVRICSIMDLSEDMLETNEIDTFSTGLWSGNRNANGVYRT